MSEGWLDYFLLIGSAAAALIGLLFVVVTLSQGRDLSAIERGQKLYMTPILYELGGILLLSGLAMSPATTPTLLGLATAIVGLIGVVAAIRIAIGIRVGPYENTVFDTCWYGFIPGCAYLLLIAAGGAQTLGSEWAFTAIAALLMAQLLINMHNAWDLVTYLAPRSSDQQSGSREQ